MAVTDLIISQFTSITLKPINNYKLSSSPNNQKAGTLMKLTMEALLLYLVVSAARGSEMPFAHI